MIQATRFWRVVLALEWTTPIIIVGSLPPARRVGAARTQDAPPLPPSRLQLHSSAVARPLAVGYEMSRRW